MGRGDVWGRGEGYVWSSLQVRIWVWREVQRMRMEACGVMLPAAELS